MKRPQNKKKDKFNRYSKERRSFIHTLTTAQTIIRTFFHINFSALLLSHPAIVVAFRAIGGGLASKTILIKLSLPQLSTYNHTQVPVDY